MNQDAVIILEDNEEVIQGFKQQFEDIEIDIEPIYCKTYDEYIARAEDEVIKARVKCVIMDLSNNQTEDEKLVFKSIKYIEQQYSENRIPIFIHSGYLAHYNGLSDQGTVYKIEKSKNSVKEIVDKIKRMYESGFLDIFCKQGRLETQIMKQIHNAFVTQFKGNEIELIIRSIESASTENLRDRTAEVFERIALRAVYQNAISTIINDEAIKVNSIEHYYRRTNRDKLPFWTGDVFEIPASAERDAELIVVVTPRCNAANCNYEQILFCAIESLDDEQKKKILNSKKEGQGETKGQKYLRNSITDNAIGERLRFLPKTPQFPGGFVDFVKCFTVTPDRLKTFIYKVSLVDDLTNDVVRKLATYLLRGGISDTAYQEAHYYFKEISEENNEGKVAV